MHSRTGLAEQQGSNVLPYPHTPWGPLHWPGHVAEHGPYRALSGIALVPYPQDNGLPYTMACEYGDIAMLRCLRRVGCAWGPRCSAFVHEACPSRLPVLRALLQLGCPVQWEAALAAARGRVGRGGEMLVGWLTEERARREAAERGQQQQELQGMM